MDVIQPLPLFIPSGVAVHNGDAPTTPPKTRVVAVHGLSGQGDDDDVPTWEHHWIPPDSSDGSPISHSYGPFRILRSRAPENALETEARKLLDRISAETNTSNPGCFYAMWAEDIGGIIVKLALVIAATEKQYHWIFEATQAVVFFGTPHRASSEHSLDSMLLAIITSCYSGLPGDWLPMIVNRLSRQLKDIHAKFTRIAHEITIISYYQKLPLSSSHQLVVAQHCATLGLPNEIVLGCNRSHKGMAKFMSRHEFAMLQIHMINAKISHWKKFKHCLAILEAAHPKRELDRGILTHLQAGEAMRRRSVDSKLTDWISSENDRTESRRYMRVKLGSIADPFEVLNSIVCELWEKPDILWHTCPLVDAPDARRHSHEETWIYISILQQILAQQPRIFLHIQHLVTFLADALRPHVGAWAERALWLVLRSVIHAPIEVPTYGFVPVRTPASMRVVQRINSEVEETDSKFRLVLALADTPPFGLRDLDCFDLDLESGDWENHQIGPNLPSKTADDCLVQDDAKFGIGLQDVVQYTRITEDALFQVLPHQIQALGRSAFIALVWIAFATRPLYTSELELILALNSSTDPASLNYLSSGPVSHLLKVLPDIVSTQLGKVSLKVPYGRLRKFLEGLSQKYLAPSSSPHLYIAQSCLSILVGYVFKAFKSEPVAAVKYAESENSDWHNNPRNNPDNLAKQIESHGEKSGQPVVELSGVLLADLIPPRILARLSRQDKSRSIFIDDMTTFQRGLAEYTAHNWIIHYELGGAENGPAHKDQAYHAFVEDESNVQDWLDLLEYLTRFPQRNSGDQVTISPTLMKENLNLATLQDLKVLYRLALQPSSLSGIGRLLTDAVEIEAGSVVRSLSAKLDIIPEESILRALAASTGSVHGALRKDCALFLEQQHPRRLARAQLTAQVLGNQVTSRLLREELLALPWSPDLERWFLDSLHQALEYDDEDIVDDLLRGPEFKERVGTSKTPIWTTIHRAATHGNLNAVRRLCESGEMAAINTHSPDCRSALFIASSYGFVGIVEFLIASGGYVDDVNGSLKQTALHIASNYGHWRTTQILLENHASCGAVDIKGTYPLHLAIQRGHVRVAELLAEHPPEQPTEVPATSRPSDWRSPATATSRPEKSFTYSSDTDDSDSSLDMMVSSSTMLDERPQPPQRIFERTSSALITNMPSINLLFAAADRDLPTVGRRLLQQGMDPNTPYQSRTALHMAAKAGSVDLIKDLLDAGAIPCADLDSCTPLHYACFRGHLDAVRLLAKKGGLGIKDCCDHSPLSAACAEGHLDIVKEVLYRGSPWDWSEGLAVAVRHGHYDVVKYLIHKGCPVNEAAKSGDTALITAALSDRPRIAQALLLGGANPEAETTTGERALHFASKLEFPDMVEILTATRSQVNAMTKEGYTPLGLAVYWGREATVRLLLERGAVIKVPRDFDSYSTDLTLLETCYTFRVPNVGKALLDYYPQGNHEDRMTPAKGLIFAMRIGDDELLKLILNKWFTPNGWANSSRDFAGQALLYAASNGCTHYLEAILKNPVAKTTINYTDPTSGTPLHVAICADRKSSEAVDILLDSGADIGIVAGQFGTTLNTACVMAKPGIVEKLLKLMPKEMAKSVTGRYGTAIQSAIVGFPDAPSKVTIKMLSLLVEHGHSLSAKGGLFFTAVHAALYHSDRWVVHWLLKREPSLALVQDEAGRLPIQLAIIRGDWEILKRSIPPSVPGWRFNGWRRVMVKYEDWQGRNGLHYAATSRSKTLMRDLFARSDEDSIGPIRDLVDSRDIDGWTPLHWACRGRHKEIAEALLKEGADPAALTNEGWTPRHIALFHGVCSSAFLSILPDTGTVARGLPDTFVEHFQMPCDVCLVDLCWKYHHCAKCVDFNLCFKCFRHADLVHGKHTFREIGGH